MSDHEEELLEIEREQSLEKTATDVAAIAEQLEMADDAVTIEYGDESATIPAPIDDVAFELEIEREQEHDGVEYEIEIEIEWEHDSQTEE